MGLLDTFRGRSAEDDTDDDTPQRWAIVARNSKGQAHPQPDEIESKEWTYTGDPPTKQQFTFEYGDILDGGIEYICVEIETKDGTRPNFDNVAWSHETERFQSDDDLSRIERRIEELADSGGLGGGADQPFEDRLLEMVVAGQVDLGTAREVVSLKGELENAKHGDRKDYFDDADIDNPRQIGAAALMNLFSSYDSVGDIVQDAAGGLVQAGPAAQADPSLSPGRPQDAAGVEPSSTATAAARAAADRREQRDQSEQRDEQPAAEQPDRDSGEAVSSAAAKFRDGFEAVAAETGAAVDPEVVEAVETDDTDAADEDVIDVDGSSADEPADDTDDTTADFGQTVSDAPETPEEVAEQLAEDFPAEADGGAQDGETDDTQAAESDDTDDTDAAEEVEA